MRRSAWVLVAAVLAMALGLALAAGAAAAPRYVSVEGAKAPGPSAYDRVWVEKHGPARARTVLVLIPGTSGGAGSVAPVARSLVKGVRGLQVWAFDRREQAFEDTSGFESGDPDAARDYYLGFQYDRTAAAGASFVSEWGFRTELRDLRRVIRKAGKRGRTVILGGHSRGASSAVAYAAWDFGGAPGHRSIDGLVLIDGGLAAFGGGKLSLADAQARLAEIRDGDVFNDPLGAGIPEIGQIFAQLAALYARERPNQGSVLQDHPLIPASLKPPLDVTNEAFLGYVFDKTTSPDSFASLRIRAGRLAESGDPRPWADGEITAIQRMARAFSRDPANATEWFYPNRMILDTAAANALRPTKAGDLLGLRLLHTRTIDVPLYAIQTDLTNGGVLAGAREVIERSRIRRSRLIDASRGMSHLDPVLAGPESRFTKSVIPFLERIRGR